MSNDYMGNLGLKQEAVFGEEVSSLDVVFEEIVNESIMMETEQKFLKGGRK